MKKIAVISDTHGNYSYLEKAAGKMKDCYALIHLGDGVEQADYFAQRLGIPIMCVNGNNDCTREWNNDLITTEDGIRIFCTHGHRYRVKSDLLYLGLAAEENECAIALYGHTHHAAADWYNGIYLLNPGSLGAPYGKEPPSMAILTLNAGDFGAEFIKF